MIIMTFYLLLHLCVRVSDSNDDEEFIDDQKTIFLNNVVVEYEKQIKNYLRQHDILEAYKTKINVLNEEMTILLEKKIRFFKFEHHSLLGKNNVLTQEIKSNKSFSSMNEIFHPGTKELNEILDKCKIHDDKIGLGYVNKDELPLVERLCLSKVKMKLLTKLYLLEIHYYAPIARKFDILRINATLSS